jgi:hypothetical protein
LDGRREQRFEDEDDSGAHPNFAAMKSALEVAVLLARRTGAYIEGFPLRIAIPPYVVAELTAGFAQRDEETAELRRLFETFMRGHGIPPVGQPRILPPSDGLPLCRRMTVSSEAMVVHSISR